MLCVVTFQLIQLSQVQLNQDNSKKVFKKVTRILKKLQEYKRLKKIYKLLLNYAIGKYLENNSCSTSGVTVNAPNHYALGLELVVDGNLPAIMGLAKKILSLCNRRDRKGTKKIIDFFTKT